MSSNSLNARNIQGDVILGLHKRVEAFYFLNLKGDPSSVSAFQQKLKSSLLPLITSTQDVLDNDAKIQADKDKDPKVVLPIVEMNISFSAAGLMKLGISPGDLPGQNNDAFQSTQKFDAVTNLGDPMDPAKGLKTWDSDYLRHPIDVLILVTAPDKELLKERLQQVKKILHGLFAHDFLRTANVRPGAAAGHEHFGFLDNITKPPIKGFTDTNQEVKNVGVIGPEVILIGQPGSEVTLDQNRSWMKDGAFLVVRELQQLVPEFEQFVADIAQKAGVEPGLIGARLVGRWKSGAPVVLAPEKDDVSLARSEAFDFSDDLMQQKCPYVAHTRKTNPRAGMKNTDTKTAILPHMIIRSGIPYGPELTDHEKKSKTTRHERGLMFVCYQSRIEDGFQFIQKSWCNNPSFPPNNPSKVTAGIDLVIGQTASLQPRIAQNIVPEGKAGATDANNTVTALKEFVIPRGGEYFFTPSLDAIANKLGQ